MTKHSLTMPKQLNQQIELCFDPCLDAATEINSGIDSNQDAGIKSAMTPLLQAEMQELISQLRTLAPHAQWSSDSRNIAPGDIFFAFPIMLPVPATAPDSGAQIKPRIAGDGRKHIAAALANGAVAVVYDPQDFSWDQTDSKAVHFAVAELAAKAGFLAQLWYAQDYTQTPTQAQTQTQPQPQPQTEHQTDFLSVAVTGTNGKTSCSQWIAKALSLCATPCAVIGTLGVGKFVQGQLNTLEETGFTTPDAIQLQRRLSQLKQQGAKALAIEASSIGLEQGRMHGLPVNIALLTNLTRDHLDYHGDMESYAAAKKLLFQTEQLDVAVLNLDDAFGLELFQQYRNAASLHGLKGRRVLAYSIEHAALPALTVAEQVTETETEPENPLEISLLHASHLRTNHAGTSFHVDSPFGSGTVKTQMIGRFNVSNVLGVLCVLLAQGVAWNKAVSVIEKLSSVPGRMQQMGTQGHVMVVIDYAHTPDALEKTLQTLQQVANERHGHLWCVFGCGGDRDPGKRAQMGRCAELAQHVVVTSDNPRFEDPNTIIEHILSGMSSQNSPERHVIAERANAILYAIRHAANQDVVLLAGKGHETYQDIKGKKWPFSDESHAALALATVATSGNHMKRGS